MTSIRLLDDKYDKEWTTLIFNLCNLDYNIVREEKLTRELLELHLDEIIQEIFKYIKNYKYIDSVLIGFQILGIFILKTGARLPDIVRNAILFSTVWEYDKSRGWGELFVEDRKENLKKFREAILNHKQGQITKVTF